MSEFFTLLLREAESGWVWMYTAGMPDEARAARVDELESDAREHEAEANARGGRFGMEFLHRFVFGMPADIGWRVSHGREGFEPRNWLALLISCLLVVGLVVALAVAAVLLPHANPPPSRQSTIGPLLAVDCLLVILVLVLPGVLVIDRWPGRGRVAGDHRVSLPHGGLLVAPRSDGCNRAGRRHGGCQRVAALPPKP